MNSSIKKQRLFSNVILLILLASVGLTMLTPYLWMLSASFKKSGEVFSEASGSLPGMVTELWPKAFRFSNYSTVLIDSNLLKGFWNTAKIFLIVLPVGLFSTSIAAFAFAKMRFRGSKALFAMLLATMMIPFPVVMMPQYYFFTLLNLRDSYIPLILPGCLGNISAMFFLIQFLKNIPDSLIECAKVDGASFFRIYARIILPLIQAAVATQGIFWFMAIWNDLLGPIIYLNTVEKYTVTAMLASLNTVNNTGSQLTQVMAGSVLASLPLLIVFIIFQKQIIQSLALSGIKG